MGRSDAVRTLARYGRFYCARIGVPGVVGVALLIFAAAFSVLALVPLVEEVTVLRARAERVASTQERGTARPGGPAGEQAALEAFARRFPPVEQAAQRILDLHATAKRNGLTLETGEYNVTPDRDARLLRYQVRVPVKGGYVELRRFVADAMREIPTMMLDEVTIRRAALGAREIEARLQFTLLFAGES